MYGMTSTSCSQVVDFGHCYKYAPMREPVRPSTPLPDRGGALADEQALTRRSRWVWLQLAGLHTLRFVVGGVSDICYWLSSEGRTEGGNNSQGDNHSGV